MANWQYEINIKPIHDAYRDTEDLEALKASMAQECRQLSEKISLNPDYQILQELADRFEKGVEDIDEYDDVLSDLYDWGDYNHKCWVGSF